jgi:hypothetical protein
MCKMLGVRLVRRIEFAIHAYVSGVGQTPNVKEARRIPSRAGSVRIPVQPEQGGK